MFRMHEVDGCSSVRSFGRALALATMLSAALLAAGAVNASAATTATISGHVTDNGSPAQDLSNICVQADGDNGGFGFAQTDANGQYTISNLDPDTYRVQFSDCSGNNDFSPQYYNNKQTFETADKITLAAGGSKTGVNAKLAKAGKISGTVTDKENGAKLAGICVSASGADGGGSAQTASDGTYTVRGLDAGPYKVQFSDCAGTNYLSQYYNGKDSFQSADPVSVATGATTSGIDAKMAQGGKISGTVTDTASPGNPLSNICVGAYQIGASGGFGGFYGFAQTDASGHYTITGLHSGGYGVGFSDCSTGAYVGQYYNNKPDYSSADRVAVTQGQTAANINARLQKAGKISGKVTDKVSGDGLPNQCVVAQPTSGSGSGGYTQTDTDGTYTISGLAPGTYKVQFSCDGFFGDSSYAVQYYNGKPTSGTADVVTVTAGQETKAIDAKLAKAGSVSGNIKDSAGNNLSDVCVTAYPSTATDAGGTLDQAGQDYSDGSGNYKLGGLQPGSYKIGFSDCGGGHFATQFYNNKVDLDRADSVTVTADQDKPNINAKMAAGGSISGTAKDSHGNGVGHVCVTAEDAGGHIIGSTLTYDNFGGPFGPAAAGDGSGSYFLSGLPPGSYKVRFFTAGCPMTSRSFASQYYSNKADAGTANPVTVTAGGDQNAVDATLVSTGGAISGKVTDKSTSAALGGQCVTVYTTGGSQFFSLVGGTSTAADGTYLFDGLAPGSYKVAFGGCDQGDYLTQFFNNKPDYGSADTVSVTKGQTTANVSAALVSAGRISGKVTDNGNPVKPLANICVTAFSSDSGDEVSFANTAGDGTYTLKRLATGNYIVQFSDCGFFGGNGEYLTQYYKNVSDRGSATEVSATAGQTTNNIDAKLQRSGHITGTVTDTGSPAQPLTGICVTAEDPSPFSFNYASATTDANGKYTLTGLQTGSYRVTFTDCRNGDYATEYYNDKTDPQSYDPVQATVGQDTTGIDAKLGRAGKISGTVTDTATPPHQLQHICVLATRVGATGSPLAGPSGHATTDASGNYAIAGLTPGSYKVQFSTCFGGTSYAIQFYKDKPDFTSADIVTVTAAQTTTKIDAHLTHGGNIAGTVTGPDGNGLADICVDASRSDGATLASGKTDADGVYSIAGLPAGSYKVHFAPCPGSPDNSLPEYYNDKHDVGSANSVAVRVDQTTSNIDAELASGGEIDGRVTDTASHNLSGICVTGYSGGVPVASARTAADGTYAMHGLAAGSYKVGFDNCGSSVYAAQFYNDKPTLAQADPVDVATGAPTTGIDAALVEGGKIGGTVTNSAPTPRPIAGICVDAFGPGGSGHAQTDANGEYIVKGLQTDSYKVEFTDCVGTVWKTQWYNGKTSQTNADPVSVTQGATTSGIDAHLSSTDTTKPQTTLDSHPSSPSSSADATFTYESSKPNSTFECKLDAGAFADCPAGGQTYHSLSEASHTFQVRAIDQVGNFDDTPASFTWAVDMTAPTTTLDTHPDSVSKSKDATFTYHSDDSSAKFECKLDAGAFGACPAGGKYTGLADGSHTFSVRAADAAGNQDATPETFTWTIDTTAPDTTVTEKPPALSKSSDATFKFDSTEPGSTFECKLDAGAFGPCPDGGKYSGLADGQHKFMVRATDKAGNADASPATITWTIDTTPPSTTLDPSGPSGTTESRAGTFKFTADDSNAAFECKLDGGAFAACQSPQPYANMAIGSHSFQVRATDQAGNVESTPESRTWAVAPNASIVSGPGDADNTPPGDTTNATDSGFRFASTGSASTYECKLDAAATFSACTNPKSSGGLAAGSHTLSVRALESGQTDPTPAVRTWTIQPAAGHQRSGGIATGTDAVSNDALAAGATAGNPLVVSVDPAHDGDSVTLDVSNVSGTPPTGFTLFGKQVDIVTPASDSTHPLVITFTLDASLIPAGVDATNAAVFRNGSAAPACDGSGNALPGGLCVKQREALAGGDIRLTILADHASTWQFGKPTPAPVDNGNNGNNGDNGDAGNTGTPQGTTPPPVNTGTVGTPATPAGPGPATKCKVPKLKGKTLAKAKRVLKRAHCKVGKVKKRKNRTVKKGRVISTKPGVGKVFAAGKKVSLVVSKGK